MKWRNWNIPEILFGRVLVEIRDQVGATRAIVLAIQRGVDMVRQEVKDFAARMDAATNNLAADIQRIKDQLAAAGKLTDEEKAELERIASRAEAMANDPDNPDPEAPPVEPPVV